MDGGGEVSIGWPEGEGVEVVDEDEGGGGAAADVDSCWEDASPDRPSILSITTLMSLSRFSANTSLNLGSLCTGWSISMCTFTDPLLPVLVVTLAFLVFSPMPDTIC